MLLCRELTVQKLFRVANELYVNVRERNHPDNHCDVSKVEACGGVGCRADSGLSICRRIVCLPMPL